MHIDDIYKHTFYNINSERFQNTVIIYYVTDQIIHDSTTTTIDIENLKY